jgi:hypothetical protein
VLVVAYHEHAAGVLHEGLDESRHRLLQ